MSTRGGRLLPIVLGSIAAIAHAIVIGVLLVGAKNVEGSWGGFLPFLVDFPISILFFGLSHYIPLSLLHFVLGSLWWFSVTWAVSKLVILLIDRSGRSRR
jgi:hypothetical protein